MQIIKCLGVVLFFLSGVGCSHSVVGEDVTSKRKTVALDEDVSGDGKINKIEETIEIELTNTTDKAVEFTVKEVMGRGLFWEISSSTHTPSLRKIEFPAMSFYQYEENRRREASLKRKKAMTDFVKKYSKIEMLSCVFNETPFEDCLQELRRLTGLRIEIDKSVTEESLKTPVLLSISNMPIGVSLEWIARQAHCKYEVDGEAIRILQTRLYCTAVLMEYNLPPELDSSIIAEIINGALNEDEMFDFRQSDNGMYRMMCSESYARYADFLMRSILDAFEKRCVDFTVNVPAFGTAKLKYTVKYKKLLDIYGKL